jgi:hypothetical protein
VRLFLVVFLFAALAAACAKTHAKTEPELPSLDAPPPPPRVIVPVEAGAPPARPEPEAATRPPARRPAQRTETAKADVPPVKADAAKGTTDAAKPPAQPDAAKAGMLETGLPGSQAEVERTVRNQLEQATRDLQRVDRNGLNTDGKAQFDSVKRLIDEGEQALKDRNLVYASKISDKAATLAALLVRR